ncbi:hypothetical protein CHUAL_010530 [Chamberlinius hualienensis]
MNKLNDSWKQQKKLNVSINKSTPTFQERTSYLKERIDFGNTSNIINDDEDFLDAVNDLEKHLSSSTTKTKTLTKLTETSDKMNNSQTNLEPKSSYDLKLSSLILPDLVLEQYKKCGVESMFMWQAECLQLDGILKGRNLVYSAPTSAGKTLVAEILMLKCVLEMKKKAIMVLPFVSVTREKVYHLQKLFQCCGIRVDGFMGNYSPVGGFELLDIAICTIEKANGLVNRLIEDNSIGNLGIMVVDELHMLGDPHRGYLLELMLTKLLYLQKRSTDKPDSTPSIPQPIQIVGMSATLPNLKLVADWLSSELYCTEFRPVPLSERVKIGNVIYCAKSMNVVRTLPPSTVEGDIDNLVYMSIESIASNQGIVIFCPTKSWCERLAETIARSVNEVGREHRIASQNKNDLYRFRDSLRANLNVEDISQVLEHLGKSPAGLDKVLAKTVALGVAYHHAGLTFDEREIIEGAFRRGVIKVLTATSTLSSGVNLPARRVIIRTPIFHGSLINVLTYRQMIGRAGRTGLDTEGESILICKENERNKADILTNSNLPAVTSCLARPGQSIPSSFKRAMLEIIVSGAANSEDEAIQYASCTLLEASLRQSETSTKTKELIDGCLQFLIDNEFVKKDSNCDNEMFISTALGRAVLASSLSPDEGLIVYEELERARRCFVLENDLHVVYQVTPLNMTDQWPNIDWLYYTRLWERLPNDMKRVAECVGVEERYLLFAMKNESSLSNGHRRTRLLRFYSALALLDLVNEEPLTVVAAKYGCSRGMLQSLQQSAATFAGMVTIFCHHLGWTTMELLLANFQNRLYFGVQQELCDLVRINVLNASLARGLYNAGIKTVASLASASLNKVINVIGKSTPFESIKQRDIETAMEAEKRVKKNSVWILGREPMSDCEAAKTLISEARNLLKDDLGASNVHFKWENDKESLIKTEIPINIDEDVDKFHQNTVLVPSAESVINIPNNETVKDLYLNDSEDYLFPGQIEKPQESNCSLNLNTDDDESSEIFVENNMMSDTDSELSLSLSISEKSSKIKFDGQTKHERTLYLSDTDTDDEIKLKISSRDNSKAEEIVSDANDSLSLFPEMDISSTKKIELEVCSESLINRFLNDSACFTLSRSTTPDNLDLDQDQEESQELFEVSKPRSSPTKLNHQLETKDSLNKRLKVENKFRKSFCLGCQSDVCDCDVQIVDVKNLGEFLSDWLQQTQYILSFACEKFPISRLTNNLNQIPSTSNCNNPIGLSFLGSQVNIVGLAISWQIHTVFYINFNLLERKDVCEMIKKGFKSQVTKKIVGYSLKEQLRLMDLIFDCLPHRDVVYSDPKIGSWLLDQDNTLNFAENIEKFLPGKLHLVREFLPAKVNVGPGTSLTLSRHTARMRAAIEADLIHHLAFNIENKLQETCLLNSFYEIEMKCLLPLFNMEMTGIGIDAILLQKSADLLKENLKSLEITSQSIVGHELNLASPAEVSKVLYSELRLNFTNDDDDGELKTMTGRNSLLRGTSTSLKRQVKRRGQNLTMKTNKEILKKLTDQHELPSIILTWRKLHSALCKSVIPLLKLMTFIPHSKMYRVMSYCEILTATGRINLSEPDVQIVPRDFTVSIPKSENITVSLRKSFIPFTGGVLVGADFSQLELRILAELSNDCSLKSSLNGGEDVFKSIAAKWRDCSLDEVSDVDRQNAKQICYGMIYGMGAKTLGEQLDIDYDEALEFMEEFKSRYPDVRRFINSTVDKCRKLGYVETLSGRRRYLKNIESHCTNTRLHGERQAVNSTIQGSAADIFKTSIIAVESCLDKKYTDRNVDGPRLVLQLHDELLYECVENEALNLARIMKNQMENCVILSVNLPVKVKMGPSWGDMKYIDF